MMVLGLDTSNYTTSAAAFDGVSGKTAHVFWMSGKAS